jgi:hypothetical protein
MTIANPHRPFSAVFLVVLAAPAAARELLPASRIRA